MKEYTYMAANDIYIPYQSSYVLYILEQVVYLGTKRANNLTCQLS